MECVKCLFLICALVVLQNSLQVAAKSLKLPPFIKKACSKNDPNLDQCVIQRGREVLPYVIKGVPAIQAPPLDPLMIPEVRVDQNVGSSVGISIVSKDLKITGLKDIIFDDCHLDLKKRRVEAWYSLPRLEIVGRYQMDGRILVLPIQGKGDSNFTLVGNKLKQWFTYDLVDKDGEKYMKLKDDDLLFNTSRAYFKLTNLFNGDKALGDNMNQFLNENWSDVMKEIGPDIIVAVRTLLHAITEGVLDHFSYDTIFPDTV